MATEWSRSWREDRIEALISDHERSGEPLFKACRDTNPSQVWCRHATDSHSDVAIGAGESHFRGLSSARFDGDVSSVCRRESRCQTATIMAVTSC
jgi:hypothetical protein